MEVLLLGTGTAEGWPEPFCGCASCAGALARGEVRGPTGLLVDEVLLLDGGTDAARAAIRAGRDPARVRHLLRTGVDDSGPERPPWPPERAVVQAPGRSSERLRLGKHDVRVLAAGPAAEGSVLCDVSGPDGSRLLYGTVADRLPAPALRAVQGAGYDLVLLGDAGVGRGPALPSALADLRRTGAVADRTDVVAIGLGHHHPPGAELVRRLTAWGVRVVPDGTVLHAGAAARTPESPRRLLVLGGARSGKSSEAERRLLATPGVTYVATGGLRPDDVEWQRRVAEHRARRPATWRTVETGDVAAVLRGTDGPVLVDCLTLWLSGVMDEHRYWDEPDDGPAARAVAARVDDLVSAWREVRVPAVAVSNEVGSGVVPSTHAGRRFRDALGALNTRLAAESDEVVLVVAGRVLPL